MSHKSRDTGPSQSQEPTSQPTSQRIGDFRVAFRLCFKASPSAKPFTWKLILFTCKRTKICVWIKLISLWKASHEDSLWNRGEMQLGNRLLCDWNHATQSQTKITWVTSYVGGSWLLPFVTCSSLMTGNQSLGTVLSFVLQIWKPLTQQKHVKIWDRWGWKWGI